MLPIETTPLHVRPWPAYLVTIISIAIFFVPEKNNLHGTALIGSIMLVFSILLWFLLSRTQIIVDDRGITHRTFFKTKKYSWTGVSKTYIKYHQHEKTGSFDWYLEYFDGRVEQFSINLLSRKSIRTIAEAVTTKCKTADIEKRIYDMAEGQFPWYIW